MGKKKKWFRKNRICVLTAGALFSSCLALPSEAGVRMRGDDGTAPVLVLGADLSESQKEEVLELLELDEGDLADCRVLAVTGEQVREKLGDSWPEEAVEDMALSCILVRQVYAPVGLQVTVENIDWCTEEMYQKLLSEAGILSREDKRQDLDVRVAAPSAGSAGTAALIGALTACEEIRGQELGVLTG